MARGGLRLGAGRPRLSDEEKAARAEARKLKRAAAAPKKAAAKKAKKPAKAPKVARAVAPTGEKPAEAATWPFGTQVPTEAAPASVPAVPANVSPLDFLLGVMRDPMQDVKLRMTAAQIAAPFVHTKPGELGKKAAKDAQAKEVAGSGRFAPSAPPRLVHSR
jgi:phage terminase small subunit